MAVDMQLKIENKAVIQSLYNFSALSGVPVRFIVADQLRLWVQDVVKLAPPKNRRQGRAAVESDLNKLFVVKDRKPVIDFFQENFTDNTALPSSVQMKFNAPKSELKRFHQKYRNKKGRVRYKGMVVKNIGGIDFYNKWYISRKQFNEYKKEVFEKIGMLKASFIPAIDALASFVNTKGIYAAWLKKVNMKLGSYSLMTMKPDGNGKMYAVSFVSYSEDQAQRLVNQTRRKRDIDIRKQLPKRIDKLVEQFNKGRLMGLARKVS
jgi:hypothetical protein